MGHGLASSLMDRLLGPLRAGLAQLGSRRPSVPRVTREEGVVVACLRKLRPGLAQLFPVSCLFHCSPLLHFHSCMSLDKTLPRFYQTSNRFHRGVSFVTSRSFPLSCFPTSLSIHGCLSILPNGFWFDSRQGPLSHRRSPTKPTRKRKAKPNRIQDSQRRRAKTQTHLAQHVVPRRGRPQVCRNGVARSFDCKILALTNKLLHSLWCTFGARHRHLLTFTLRRASPSPSRLLPSPLSSRCPLPARPPMPSAA